VLIENVPDLTIWDNGSLLGAIIENLEVREYSAHAQVVPCWRYGVPQHRERLFVVGVRGGTTFEWPEPSSSRVTLREAISDLPSIEGGRRDYWMPLETGAQSPFQEALRVKGSKLISDHITRQVRDDDLEIFKLMKAGTRYGELPVDLQRYRADIFSDKYHVLGWDRLSRSITAHIAKDGYWYIHPEARRSLSIREAARLQTFPDWFRFAGYPSDRLRQIGNAVPPLVATRIGERILSALRAPSDASPSFRTRDFRRRILRWHRRQDRAYPWRDTRDPWLVLATEILLRRTRADAVAEVWPAFARDFDSPKKVVRRQVRLRKLLNPLGLRWRVDNLIALASELVAGGSQVPRDRAALMDLPGVGDYVADAVLAFAYGDRSVLIDSNTARIATRVFGLDENPTSLRNFNLRAAVSRLVGGSATPKMNWALLDFGGVVCTSRRPKCDRCPIGDMCEYRRTQPTQPELHPS
jgi:DNA (cytosine-5)-methyltransferase 1